jgi:hypothetical protein
VAGVHTCARSQQSGNEWTGPTATTVPAAAAVIIAAVAPSPTFVPTVKGVPSSTFAAQRMHSGIHWMALVCQ